MSATNDCPLSLNVPSDSRTPDSLDPTWLGFSASRYLRTTVTFFLFHCSGFSSFAMTPLHAQPVSSANSIQLTCMRLQKRRLIDAGFGNSATSSEDAHDPEIMVSRAAHTQLRCMTGTSR